MAKNESSKSKAELYREERKARIAKAAKKNAKSIEKRTTAAGIIKKVVAIVLVVAIVGFAGFEILDSTGVINRAATALKVGNTKVSAAEFNYYYSMAFNEVANQAYQYEQAYGYNPLGFDSSLPPDEQESTQKDEDGNVLTWDAVLKDRAVSIAQQTVGYYNEAVAAGTELTEDQKSEINETIETYRTQAAENNYSLNAFLKTYFGAGFNEKAFVKQLEMELLAQNFTDAKQKEVSDAITDETVAAEYKANQKKYDYADVRYYSLAFKTLTKNEGETDDALKARQKAENDKLIAAAKDIAAKATDENALIEAVKAYNNSKEDTTKKLIATSYDSLSTAVGADGADWAFAAGRKAGEVNTFAGEKSANIIFVIKPTYTSNSVSVRHCLVEFEAKDENNVTDAEKQAANKIANDLLKGLGDKVTEDAFSKMVKENTADTASAETGGLYENIRISDSFVENFEKWSFDPARKAGDTGIVETEYGYHIMYFVSDNTDDIDWKAAIKDEMTNKELTAFQEDLFKEDGKNVVDEKTMWTDRAAKQYSDTIRKNLAYSQLYS
ncbi:MAG: peptidylprolyl isomerase [Acutalibacteraceae bacterium]|nr:peptidylprolyl isomerase [Acutalibacteraceae bacterium]